MGTDDQERVLDSSVLLAALQDERSDRNLMELIDGGVMSAVNLSEVFSKARELGLADAPELLTMLTLLARIEPFTATQARRAADLRTETKKRGLSLGDRCCLDLAITLNAPVYTAEVSWSQVDVPCTVNLVRTHRK